MALRGTLGDFSVADIFQLIGHQQKTGALRIWNRGAEIVVLFSDGTVVGASESQRSTQDLLGNMMLRAEVLSGPQLEAALDEQRRSMRRLGDVLVSNHVVDVDTLREFAKLQITETIYRLFRWKAGSYEFVPRESVDFDAATMAPIRAENLLMEAFRIVDEWPSVKRVIPTLTTQFSPIKPLPPAESKASDDDDILAGFEDLMMGDESGDEEQGGSGAAKPARVGANERKVYDLVAPGRTAQEIVDRSRLGEFETCKALASLVTDGYLEAKVPAPKSDHDLTLAERLGRVTPVLMRIALYAVVAVAFGGLLKLYQWQGSGLLDSERRARVRVLSVEKQLGAPAMERLRAYIEAYRYAEGAYPERLSDLLRNEQVSEDILRGPFKTRFAYERTTDGYSLAPPFR